MLLPLVAFDERGNRIGMGGGFYDRTLANLQHSDGWQRPKRIGVAYQLQQTRKIPSEEWDIPLHAVATEQGITWFEDSK
jgi:5-formyltetrahydrofolate cyclo-ligase